MRADLAPSENHSLTRSVVAWLVQAACLQIVLVSMMLFGVVAATLIPVLPIQQSINSVVLNKDNNAVVLNKDNYEACVAGGVGIPRVADGLLEQALLSPTFETCDNYRSFVATGKGFIKYWRFWHGFQIVTKPLLAIGGVRYLNFFGLGAVLLCTTFFLWQLLALGTYRYAVASLIAYFCVPLALVMPGVTDGLLKSLAFGPAGFLIWLSRRGLRFSIARGAHWFMLLGALTIYFDWVTIPLLTLTVPLLALLWCSLSGKSLFGGSLTLNFLTFSAAWGTGYIGTWIAKWVLVAVFTSENDVFTSSTAQILYRTGYSIALWEPVAANLWRVRIGIIVLFFLLIAGALSIGVSVRLRRSLVLPTKDIVAATIIPFAMPFLWMALVRQHSLEHSFVPAILYANFAIGFSIGLAILELKGRREMAQSGTPRLSSPIPPSQPPTRHDQHRRSKTSS